ncbi:MAG TPA: hypothetical protein VFB96_20330 [Pirellulaceae bacterium]|nr:hypothetical protein [Pirellulaceae bacterium]
MWRTFQFMIPVLLTSAGLLAADKPAPKEIARYVADLDSDDPKLRDAAEKALVEAGLPAIESVGKAALAGKAVQRFRAIRVLGKLVRSDDGATAAAAAKALKAVVAGDDATSAKQAKEELSYFDRLETMHQLAQAFEVFDTSKDLKGERVTLIAKPLHRFQDTQRDNLDGTLWAYGQRGRPKAVIAVFPFSGRGEGEFIWYSDVVSLSDGPIRASKVDGSEELNWSPKNSGEEFKPFPDAEPPAGDADKRLMQMHALVKRLEARSFTEAGTKPYDLSLWPKLLHRYADQDAEILDGGVFIIVHDTNPEVIVLVEAQRKSGAATWKYALARHGAAPLHVELDGKEVWGGEMVDFLSGGANPYWVLRRLVAGQME